MALCPKRPAIIVIDSATYLFMISSVHIIYTNMLHIQTVYATCSGLRVMLYCMHLCNGSLYVKVWKPNVLSAELLGLMAAGVVGLQTC